MARIAVINIGMHGHVNPTLGFTQMLVERGHEVFFLSTPEFSKAITKTGAQFVSYPSIIGQEIAATAKIQAESVAHGEAPPQDLSVLKRFIHEFAGTFQPLMQQISTLKPDLIIYDFVSLATWIIAKHLNIKTIKFFTTYASNSHYSLMRETFAKHEPPTPESIGQAQRVIDGICSQNGCESQSLLQAIEHIDDDNLVFMPQSFQPQGSTFDSRFHFVGPCLRPGHHQDVLSLVPGGTGPILLISLGSLFHQWLEFYRHCLKAFGNTPWRVVMATGNLDPAELGPIPSNMAIMSHIPQVELLAHASLFISHGGMNSTMEAGYFGVPLVVIPQIEEQEVTARRVEEVALGRYLKRSEVTAELLKTTVEEVFNSPTIFKNMKSLKDEIHGSGGSTRVSDLIDARLQSTAAGKQAVFQPEASLS